MPAVATSTAVSLDRENICFSDPGSHGFEAETAAASPASEAQGEPGGLKP